MRASLSVSDGGNLSHFSLLPFQFSLFILFPPVYFVFIVVDFVPLMSCFSA